MIPRVLHFVWRRGEPPERLRVWRKAWEELHPSWESRSWSSKDVPGEKPPKNCCHDRQWSNWVRLQALWVHGGVYVDYDTQPVRNIEPLLAGHVAVATPFFGRAPTAPECCNSFLAAILHHPWIGECLKLLEKADPAVHLSMGSSLISEALAGRTDVHIANRFAVLQRPGWHRLGRNPPPTTFAIHHFANMDPGVCGG